MCRKSSNFICIGGLICHRPIYLVRYTLYSLHTAATVSHLVFLFLKNPMRKKRLGIIIVYLTTIKELE